MILTITAIVLSTIAFALSVLALCGVGSVSIDMKRGLGRVIMALRRVDGLPESPADMNNPLADIGRNTPRAKSERESG